MLANLTILNIVLRHSSLTEIYNCSIDEENIECTYTKKNSDIAAYIVAGIFGGIMVISLIIYLVNECRDGGKCLRKPKEYQPVVVEA
jgi:hypothetical protein